LGAARMAGWEGGTGGVGRRAVLRLCLPAAIPASDGWAVGGRSRHFTFIRGPGHMRRGGQREAEGEKRV
jgi:hypothetical protein